MDVRWFMEFLKCFFYHSTISPEPVSQSPPWLNTAWVMSCLPFPRLWMVCQDPIPNLLASPTSSPLQTPPIYKLLPPWLPFAAAFLACRYLSAVSGDLSTSSGLKASLFQLNSFLHHRCPPVGSRFATRTGTNSLLAEALCSRSSDLSPENGPFRHSMSPTSLGTQERIF